MRIPISGVDCSADHLEKKLTFYVYGYEKAVWNIKTSLKDQCFINAFQQTFSKIFRIIITCSFLGCCNKNEESPQDDDYTKSNTKGKNK